MALYDAVRDLPLEIEDLDFEIYHQPISPEFTRKTTVVKLRKGVHIKGADFVGVGEDVTYDAEEQQPHRLPWLDLAGSWTIDSLSKRLDEEDLFPKGEPAQAAYPRLPALGVRVGGARPGPPSGRALARRASSSASQSRSRSSPRPASASDGWLELYPDLRFKLDPTPDWTDDLVARACGGRGNVDVVDLKGAYHGTVVDNPPNAELYRRVADGFPAPGSRIRP